MNLDSLVIRNATNSDIDKISEIKVNGWKNAYIGIIDNNTLNDMTIEKEKQAYLNKYSLSDIFVAEINGDVVGFCRVYDYDKSPYEGANIDCEIREIYVSPDLKRMGIGSKLFNFILENFKNKNKKKLYLGVFEKNYNSRKFYEKMGGILENTSSLEINGNTYSIVSYLYDL